MHHRSRSKSRDGHSSTHDYNVVPIWMHVHKMQQLVTEHLVSDVLSHFWHYGLEVCENVTHASSFTMAWLQGFKDVVLDNRFTVNYLRVSRRNLCKLLYSYSEMGECDMFVTHALPVFRPHVIIFNLLYPLGPQIQRGIAQQGGECLVFERDGLDFGGVPKVLADRVLQKCPILVTNFVNVNVKDRYPYLVFFGAYRSHHQRSNKWKLVNF